MSENYQSRLQKKNVRRKVFSVVLALLFSFLFLLGYFKNNVTAVLISVGKSTLKAWAETSMNDAVYYTLSDENAPSYDELMKIERNRDGDISAFTANALKINQIARDTASKAQSNLKNLSSNGLPVPLGALTGIKVFAGLGPKIHIRILPVVSVSARFSSSFENVGINQTKHSIYLNVLSDVSIVFADKTEHFVVPSEVLLAENVILGKIPDAFLQSDLFKKTGCFNLFF